MRSIGILAISCLLLASACSPPSSGDGDGDADGDVEPADCTPGDIDCRSNVPWMCNADGDAWESRPACEGATPVCVDERGCMACAPLQRACDGNVPMECAADGSAWNRGEPCDEAAGEVCEWGVCLDPCEAAAEANSYVGCEYWAVDLPNAQQESALSPRDALFAVVISNGHTASAHVEVFGYGDDDTPILTADVPPNDLRVLEINPTRPPAETNVEGTGVHQDRAFRIVSTVPVTAYQFNPLNNTDAAYSNDASLLLPVTGLEREYIVATGDGIVGSDSGNPTITYDWGAFITVVGIEEGTEVTVEPTSEINPGGGLGGGPGVPIDATIGRFDVLNIESQPSGSGEPTPGDANLSGSHIVASHPVAVFAGNVATLMPWGPDGQCCADHLEEQIIPLAAWGRDFVVGRGMPRRVATDPEPEYYRITGGNVPPGQDSISLTYFPAAPPGAPTQLVQGQSVEFSTTTDFIVRADGPVMVTSFFVSSYITAPDATGLEMCFVQSDCNSLPWAAVCFQTGFGGQCVPIGDPSMTIIPPVEQFRDSYVFLAPLDYAHDAITLIAPVEASMLLDGAPLTGLTVVGELDGTTYGVLRHEVPDGTHRLTVEGGVQVGLIVYGMDKDVSYGYPGGLDLEAINPLE